MTPISPSQAQSNGSEWARNASAFLSLAITQRRLSWRYRRWALEDEAAGRLLAYRRDAGEARKLWRAAKDSLSWARHHRDMEARRGC